MSVTKITKIDKTQEFMSSGDAALVSILLYNYCGQEIESCLQAIFNQHYISNFEVVICDDGSVDGGWEVANRYANLYSGKVSISRNHVSMGIRENKAKGLLMCNGEYGIALTDSMEFDARYVSSVVENMQEDKCNEHTYISRLEKTNFFLPAPNSIKNHSANESTSQPLVSICIYNYNYGKYLKQCLESVFSQTYNNIEICFSDNASTDESWTIALEFAARYPEKINITRNRMNFGPNVNLWNCELNMSGKYMLKLCSDDAIKPEFIERCVTALEEHPSAGFAIAHREVMDDNGTCTTEPSFYDQSCLIPGSEQAAVYMMAVVNPSISQVIYNVEHAHGKRMAGNLNDRWFGDRIKDFHICCQFSTVYIKEAMVLHRIHGSSEGDHVDGNLVQCMGQYVLFHQQADLAGNYPNMDKAQARLPASIEKLSFLALRYSVRFLRDGDVLTAKRYHYLSAAINPDITDDTVFIKIQKYMESDPQERAMILRELNDTENLVSRQVSYKPPEGSIPIELPSSQKNSSENVGLYS